MVYSRFNWRTASGSSIQAQAGAGLEKVKWDGFFNAVGAINDSDETYLEHIDDSVKVLLTLP